MAKTPTVNPSRAPQIHEPTFLVPNFVSSAEQEIENRPYVPSFRLVWRSSNQDNSRPARRVLQILGFVHRCLSMQVQPLSDDAPDALLAM